MSRHYQHPTLSGGYSTILHRSVIILLVYAGVAINTSYGQTKAEEAFRKVSRKLSARIEVEDLSEDNKMYTVADWPDLPTDQSIIVKYMTTGACNTRPEYCSIEKSTIIKKDWTDHDIYEQWRPRQQLNDDLPIPAYIRWMVRYENGIANVFISFDAYEEIDYAMAVSLIESYFQPLHEGIVDYGLNNPSTATEETAQPEQYIRINECRQFGLTNSDNDMVISMKAIREEMTQMIQSYEKRTGQKLKSASDKFAGANPLLFGDLGGHLFTKSHEKYDIFNTSSKDERLADIIRNKYKNKKATPSDILEEALKINDNCLYDALLNCHNFTKRQGYHLRDLNEDTEATRKAYENADESYELLPALQKQKHSREEHISYLKSKFDEASKRQHNHLMNANMVRIREIEDNEGAWYHMYGVLVNSYAERENVTAFDPFGLTDRPIASKGAVIAEHYGKNYKELRSEIKDMVEYCLDRLANEIGFNLHRLLPENKSILQKRIIDLTHVRRTLTNLTRIPETPMHVAKSITDPLSESLSALKKSLVDFNSGRMLGMRKYPLMGAK